jgi:hypothetical protein
MISILVHLIYANLRTRQAHANLATLTFEDYQINHHEKLEEAIRVAGDDPRRSYSIGLEVIAPELLKEFIMEDISICSEIAWKVLKDDDAVE